MIHTHTHTHTYTYAAAAAASVVSNSVRPHRWQTTRLPYPWDSPGKNTGVGCHFLLQCMKVKSLSCIRLLVTPWTAAHQAPPSMGFSRQEYWSGVLLPSPYICIYIAILTTSPQINLYEWNFQVEYIPILNFIPEMNHNASNHNIL